MKTIEEKRKVNSKAVANFRRAIKHRSLEYKGGCCQCCGYNKSVRALTFHHIDSSKKSFGISVDGLARTWAKTKDELDKCVLLCMNCHNETHAGLHPEYLIPQ